MSIRTTIFDANPWYVIAFMLVVIIGGSVIWRTYIADETASSPPAVEQTQ